MKPAEMSFPIFYRQNRDGSQGRMIGSIPWTMMRSDGESLLLTSQRGPINVESVRISALRFSQKFFSIDLTVIDDRSILAVRRKVEDKRRSRYYAVNHLEPGETFFCAWKWSGVPGDKPKLYETIYRIYMRQVKRGRQMHWRSSPEGVYLTRVK